MVPEHWRFGGGTAATVMNPAVAVLLILTGILICLLPRRKAIVPFLLTSLLIPYDQVLVVAGLHFPLLRILILFGMVRILILKGSGNWRIFSGGLNTIDKSLILLSVVSAVAGVLLFGIQQNLVFQFGALYSALGAYVILRALIREREDVLQVIRVFTFVVVVLAGVMLFEQVTRGWNPYALLGGARAANFASDMGRDGQVRAMGSFSQPILAGVFGAAMVPLFVGTCLTEKRYRVSSVAGMIGAITMVIASHSSTPLFGLMTGLFALCLWPIRSMMRVVRWGIVLVLILLQMAMQSPVYHIITHFDISGSSYHRYALIDSCVRHFGEWWLIGTNTNAFWGWDMWDTADQYVETAINGGLLGLIFLIAILVFGFKYVGRARRSATDQKQAFFFWALGSALFTYTMSFFGISLWDQSVLGWYALLAFISCFAEPKSRTEAVQHLPATRTMAKSMTLRPVNEFRGGEQGRAVLEAEYRRR